MSGNEVSFLEDASPSMRIGVVLVVYNKRYDQSPSLLYLAKFKFLRVVLADNSTRDSIREENAEYCKRLGYDYCPMMQNVGLPRAYNRAIAMLEKVTDYVMILDDDTIISGDCFEPLRKAIAENPDTDIFVPYVMDRNLLLSPCLRKGCFFFKLSHRPTGFTSKMSAINSGMVLRTKLVTKKLPFNEHLFLDCVDHLFIIEQIIDKRKISLYHFVFVQAFFDARDAREESDKVRSLERFRIFVSDFRYFCDTCGTRKIPCEAYIFFRAVKLSVKYRDTSFLSARKHIEKEK